MTFFQAFILGIIQGLTEFIPVSSTGHLLIGQWLLGIPSNGRIFSFHVIIQLGTVLALLLFFWKDIWLIVKGFFLGIWHKKPFEAHDALLGWLLIVATIPALIVGFLLKDVMDILLRNPILLAAVRLLMSAILLAVVEYLGRHERKLESASWMDALAVGLFQIIAIFPGAFRLDHCRRHRPRLRPPVCSEICLSDVCPDSSRGRRLRNAACDPGGWHKRFFALPGSWICHGGYRWLVFHQMAAGFPAKALSLCFFRLLCSGWRDLPDPHSGLELMNGCKIAPAASR
jgi:hypothetical protein